MGEEWTQHTDSSTSACVGRSRTSSTWTFYAGSPSERRRRPVRRRQQQAEAPRPKNVLLETGCSS